MGLASARARGRMGGRPPKDKKLIEQALTLYDSRNYPVSETITDDELEYFYSPSEEDYRL